MMKFSGVVHGNIQNIQILECEGRDTCVRSTINRLVDRLRWQKFCGFAMGDRFQRTKLRRSDWCELIIERYAGQLTS